MSRAFWNLAMRTCFPALGLALVFLAAPLAAQDTGTRLFSRPCIPPAVALERLNLEKSWLTLMPTESPRDGYMAIRILPDQILVQLRSGVICSLDPVDGVIQWRVHFGVPYRSTIAFGLNDDTVFGYNSLHIFGFDRKSGTRLWEFAPPGVPAAAPLADHDQLYLPELGARMDAYVLHELDVTTVAPPPSASSRAPTEAEVAAASKARYIRALPRGVWTYFTEGRDLEHQPVHSTQVVMMPTVDGHFIATQKIAPLTLYDIAAAPLSAPLAQHETVAYGATTDQRVLAIDIPSGNILWTANTAGMITHRPLVTDEDLYVGTEGVGIYRYNRRTGEEIWHFPNGAYVLAHNRLLTYALDRNGFLAVLDRARGTLLTRLDTRDFTYPVINDVTDRVYLAANNGTILCLHDRSLPRPLAVRTQTNQAPELATPATPVPVSVQPPAETQTGPPR
jgi:outer membrane protein assembly factor BamB